MAARSLALVLLALLTFATATANADPLIGPPPPPRPSHVGEGLVVAGTVIAVVGALVTAAGLWAGFVDAIEHIDPDPESPPRAVPQGPHDAIVGGAVSVLAGGVMVLTGVIVRANRPRARVATRTTPLGFTF